MELVKVNNIPALKPQVQFVPVAETSDSHFMAANTNIVSLDELSQKHTIPVFSKDNESTISHPKFIKTVSIVTEKIAL